MKVSIVYDGRCPICRRLVAASRLRQRGAQLDAIDARTAPLDDIQGLDLRGLDLDEGFAVITDGELHYGARGARMLALLSEPSGLFFRLFRTLNASERRSAMSYPLLRVGRRLLLTLLRVPPIRTDKGSD
ncbi:DCC1-like thiol-disulfide oxidoreductase family protein [Natronospira bacteriovora]|uniref:DCC1-like thiol-disulfide oxidoreductase family protein n=1 Tax=Natronospira bacteriovora TaxID=3069753 RepID=A0ABU0W605_9GAMM|nr:DCC1-like thiol-disulfide oxidoreductase family protein [Natronospira sp. AB-CW4]MDQ2069193.1 DCC1-like thiol-disulfide oxidoreductase family protein [Natronospira sp. AB-CW4]